jgi:hypothetical protein
VKIKGSYFPGTDVSDIGGKATGAQKIMEVVYAVGDDDNRILDLSLTSGAELVSLNRMFRLCGSLLPSFLTKQALTLYRYGFLG